MYKIAMLLLCFLIFSCGTLRIDKSNKIVKRNGLFCLKTKCKFTYIIKDTIIN